MQIIIGGTDNGMDYKDVLFILLGINMAVTWTVIANMGFKIVVQGELIKFLIDNYKPKE